MGRKLIKADSDEGQQIRRLVAQARGTEMRRIKNTHYARLWVEDGAEAGDDNLGFTRPEK